MQKDFSDFQFNDMPVYDPDDFEGFKFAFEIQLLAGHHHILNGEYWLRSKEQEEKVRLTNLIIVKQETLNKLIDNIKLTGTNIHDILFSLFNFYPLNVVIICRIICMLHF